MESLGQDFGVYVRSLYKVIKLHPTWHCEGRSSLIKYECYTKVSHRGMCCVKRVFKRFK